MSGRLCASVPNAMPICTPSAVPPPPPPLRSRASCARAQKAMAASSVWNATENFPTSGSLHSYPPWRRSHVRAMSRHACTAASGASPSSAGSAGLRKAIATPCLGSGASWKPGASTALEAKRGKLRRASVRGSISNTAWRRPEAKACSPRCCTCTAGGARSRRRHTRPVSTVCPPAAAAHTSRSSATCAPVAIPTAAGSPATPHSSPSSGMCTAMAKRGPSNRTRPPACSVPSSSPAAPSSGTSHGRLSSVTCAAQAKEAASCAAPKASSTASPPSSSASSRVQTWPRNTCASDASASNMVCTVPPGSASACASACTSSRTRAKVKPLSSLSGSMPVSHAPAAFIVCGWPLLPSGPASPTTSGRVGGGSSATPDSPPRRRQLRRSTGKVRRGMSEPSEALSCSSPTCGPPGLSPSSYRPMLSTSGCPAVCSSRASRSQAGCVTSTCPPYATSLTWRASSTAGPSKTRCCVRSWRRRVKAPELSHARCTPMRMRGPQNTATPSSLSSRSQAGMIATTSSGHGCESSACCTSRQKRAAAAALGATSSKASPCVLISYRPWIAIWSRITWSCASCTKAYSSREVLAMSVDSSMSVSTNTTSSWSMPATWLGPPSAAAAEPAPPEPVAPKAAAGAKVASASWMFFWRPCSASRRARLACTAASAPRCRSTTAHAAMASRPNPGSTAASSSSSSSSPSPSGSMCTESDSFCDASPPKLTARTAQ
mmetsp:Transcript_5067/g.17603  ORF Transcript_5067/g.17603 Transcript_5067/m.17603 type:complete len:719 (-) Transcript_5067:2232-4388(-)